MSFEVLCPPIRSDRALVPLLARRTNPFSRRIQKEGACGITIEGRFESGAFVRGGSARVDEWCESLLLQQQEAAALAEQRPIPLNDIPGGARLLPEKPFELCCAGRVPGKHCLQIRRSQMLCGDLTKDIAEIRG